MFLLPLFVSDMIELATYCNLTKHVNIRYSNLNGKE